MPWYLFEYENKINANSEKERECSISLEERGREIRKETGEV